MNENINLMKILKSCPEDFELYTEGEIREVFINLED